MINTSELDPKDYKFIVKDDNFNVRRNNALIAKTIEDADKFFNNLQFKLDDGMENRLDVMASYAMHRFGKGTKKIREFLGETTYRNLVGDKLIERIRVARTLDPKKDGKYADCILL